MPTAIITVPPENAALIAAGVQTIITRDKTLPHWMRPGDRLLIHAGMRLPKERSEEFLGCKPIGDWLPVVDYPRSPYLEHWARGIEGAPDDIPMHPGHIVASAILRDCVPIVTPDDDRISSGGSMVVTHGHKAWFYPEDATSQGHSVKDQLPYGDYTPGRWAWLLDDIQPTTERCPECWGLGVVGMCYSCLDRRSCPPIPAKGGPGVRRWGP